MYVKEESAECPTCGATVSIDATECPECGELFAEDVEEVVEEIEDVGEEGEIEEEKIEEEIVPGKETHGKTFFFLGVILSIIGVGSALGSLLHDWLRIDIIGRSYDAIGWLNRLVIGIGLIILVGGIIFLILSLRTEKVLLGEEIEEG